MFSFDIYIHFKYVLNEINWSSWFPNAFIPCSKQTHSLLRGDHCLESGWLQVFPSVPVSLWWLCLHYSRLTMDFIEMKVLFSKKKSVFNEQFLKHINDLEMQRFLSTSCVSFLPRDTPIRLACFLQLMILHVHH